MILLEIRWSPGYRHVQISHAENRSGSYTIAYSLAFSSVGSAALPSLSQGVSTSVLVNFKVADRRLVLQFFSIGSWGFCEGENSMHVRVADDGRNLASNDWKRCWTMFSQMLTIICISGGYQDLPLGFYQVCLPLCTLACLIVRVENLPETY